MGSTEYLEKSKEEFPDVWMGIDKGSLVNVESMVRLAYLAGHSDGLQEGHDKMMEVLNHESS